MTPEEALNIAKDLDDLGITNIIENAIAEDEAWLNLFYWKKPEMNIDREEIKFYMLPESPGQTYDVDKFEYLKELLELNGYTFALYESHMIGGASYDTYYLRKFRRKNVK
jgi:hypothetical protein